MSASGNNPPRGFKLERDTSQRRAIRKVFEADDRPLSTQEIHEAARREIPGIGIATVYRSVRNLLESGHIQEVTLPGENPRYELSGKEHHHHFRCLRCERVYEINECPGDLKKMVPEGFVLESHDLTLYGHCADCA